MPFFLIADLDRCLGFYMFSFYLSLSDEEREELEILR
jgi:hypothetical protein